MNTGPLDLIALFRGFRDAVGSGETALLITDGPHGIMCVEIRWYIAKWQYVMGIDELRLVDSAMPLYEIGRMLGDEAKLAYRHKAT